MRKLFANFIVTLLILSFLAVSAAAYTHTCAISTGRGLQQDLDCDGVPDIYDNCEWPNPDQADNNRNGIGDVCEGYVMDEGNGQFQLEPQQVVVSAPNVPDKKPKQISDFGITNLNVKIKEMQDVYIGTAGAVYPIKVTNNGREDKRVLIEVIGVDFGGFRVDPVSTLIVKAGKTESAYVHVSARDDAEEGQHDFQILFSSDKESESVDMTATVLKKGSFVAKKNGKISVADVIGWLLVIAIIVIIAILISREEKKGGRRKKIDKDIYSYY